MDCGYVFLAGDAAHRSAAAVATALPALRWWLAPDRRWVRRLREAWPNTLEAHARWRLWRCRPGTAPPSGGDLRPLDPVLAQCLARDFGIGALDNFASPTALCAAGGAVLWQNGRPVAVCCAFAAFGRERELAVATLPECRGRGHGLTVARHAIAQWQAASVRVHWDAGDLASLRLARRLGFQGCMRYVAYTRRPDAEDLSAWLAQITSE